MPATTDSAARLLLLEKQVSAQADQIQRLLQHLALAGAPLEVIAAANLQAHSAEVQVAVLAGRDAVRAALAEHVPTL